MESELVEFAPIDWRRLPIEAICSRVTSGGTPSRKRPDFYIGGRWNWVKTQELIDSWIDTTEEKITDDAIASSSAKVLPPNTVLLALYGATVGQLGILRKEMTCNQACCAMIVDPSKADYRFLFYQLLVSRSQLKRLATGAAQQNLSGQLVKTFKLPFPPIKEQKAIACILGALDDKIELNRRRNKTLEGMARALFQSWFVDFDPVRAKAAGRSPSGLQPELAKLFPDSFEDSTLGEIPKGWRIVGILEVGELLSGGTPKTSESTFWGGNIPWASAKDVSQCGEPFLIETERRITHAGLENSATRMIPAFSSVIVARGATTGRMTMFGDDIAMNQTCYALRSRSNTPLYLYLLLRHEINSIVHTAHGSVFDTITTATFQSSSVCVADLRLTSAFENRVTPFFQEVLCQLKQSATLASLRDTLLPKLISGELRISDAERIVGRAI
jgi:type I restriction enzyme S subunit